MDNKLNLNKIIDKSLFELPERKSKSSLLYFKHQMTTVKIAPDVAEIIICNKTSKYDKIYVSGSVLSPHVFLKDEIVRALHFNSLSSEELKNLNFKIKNLLELGVSVVIFPELHRTIFGEFSKIPEKITSFIKSFNVKVTFFTLIGTYFIKPVWSRFENKCITKLEQRFSLSSKIVKSSDNDDFCKKFNEYMPSSASTYTLRFPLMLYGKRIAENMESIIYACPNCNRLFTLYSEYSCVKCSECLAAFEFSSTGELNLTKSFRDLDEAKVFQRDLLESFKFGSKLVVGYKGIATSKSPVFNKKTKSYLDFLIYSTHFITKNGETETKVNYKDILDIELLEDNILVVTLKDGQKQYYQGERKENFYIIFDLMDIQKNKKAE